MGNLVKIVGTGKGAYKQDKVYLAPEKTAEKAYILEWAKPYEEEKPKEPETKPKKKGK